MTLVNPHPNLLQQSTPLHLSAAALAEAEEAHIAHGLRLQEARRAQEQLDAEAAWMEAKQARREAEASKALQDQLHQQL